MQPERKPPMTDNISKLFQTLANVGKKFSDAIQEVEEEYVKNLSLISVSQKTLNFIHLDDDTRQIRQSAEQEGFNVMGIYLELNNKKAQMNLQIFLQKDDRFFRRNFQTEINYLEKFPDDVMNELEKKGYVKLHLLGI